MAVVIRALAKCRREVATCARACLPEAAKQKLRAARGKWRSWQGARASRRHKQTLDRLIVNCPDRKGIVVLPPLIDWNWMKQRPHHLMMEFARGGYLVFFCSPRVRGDDFDGLQNVEDNLYLCSCVELLHDLDKPIVMATHPGHWDDVRQFRDPVILYDHLDDLAVHCEGNVINAEAERKHHELLQRASVVSATSERLYTRMLKSRPDAILCPNGVNIEHFRQAGNVTTPSDMAPILAKQEPVIGYYGALAKWFDYALLAEVAIRRPSYQFVLIGPNYDGSLNAAKLDRYPNIHWLGEKKYEELPSYAAHFAVATIPFCVNEITLCTSPVKLFEYMAAQKPVVSTPLPECVRHRGVLIGNGAAEFAERLDQAVALKNDRAHAAILAEEAQSNTWRARFQTMDRQLHRHRMAA